MEVCRWRRRSPALRRSSQPAFKLAQTDCLAVRLPTSKTVISRKLAVVVVSVAHPIFGKLLEYDPEEALFPHEKFEKFFLCSFVASSVPSPQQLFTFDFTLSKRQENKTKAVRKRTLMKETEQSKVPLWHPGGLQPNFFSLPSQVSPNTMHGGSV